MASDDLGKHGFKASATVVLTHFSRNIPFTATHYTDVILGAMASQITSLVIVYSTVYSGADQRKHQSSASLAFVRGIHRGPVNSPRKGPVTWKMFPFDDVIMERFNFSFSPSMYAHSSETLHANRYDSRAGKRTI